VTDRALSAELLEEMRRVGLGVIREHLLHPYSMTTEKDQGSPEEGSRSRRFLVREDLDVSQPGMIIDGHVYALPAGATMPIPSIATDPMADAANPTEFLHVEMNEIARRWMLVAHDRLGRLEGAKTSQAVPGEDRRNRRTRHVDLGRDLLRGQTTPAEL
jgi:hypothetical protein